MLNNNRCHRLILRTSKMLNPQLACSAGFASLGGARKKISHFFLVDMPDPYNDLVICKDSPDYLEIF